MAKTSTAVIMLLGVYGPSSLANQDGQVSNATPQMSWEPVRSACHETIERYLEWHSIASAVGSDTGEIEYQWMQKTGLQSSGSLNDFHVEHVVSTQSIQSIESVAVSCSGEPSTDGYEGQMYINASLHGGQKAQHFFSLKGADAYSLQKNNTNVSFAVDDFQPLAQTYHSQLRYLKEYYRQVIRQLNESNPTNLTFTDDVVELWFAWPAGKLMTADEKRTHRNESAGQNIETQSIKSTRVTALTQADNGVRVSRLYSGKQNNLTKMSESEQRQLRQSYINRCNDNIRYCFDYSTATIPFHYSMGMGGERSTSLLDETYTSELKKWMEDVYASEDGYDEYVSKMLEEVQRNSINPGYDLIDGPLEDGLVQFHNEELIRGKVYSKFYVPLYFNRKRYAHPRFEANLMSMETRYLGKVACNDSSNDKLCVHLEFRMRELDPKVLTLGNIGVHIDVDVKLEPHTLLLHNVDYDSTTTIHRASDLAKIDNTKHYSIDIEYKYEELPE